MNELMADVWKALKELVEAQQRTEKAQQRTEKAQQRTETVLAKAREEVAEAQKETERVQQETKKELKELGKRLDQASGNFNNKWGRFLEGFVKGNLIALLRKNNIDVGRVQPRLQIPSESDGQLAGDFDLVALNGKEIVAVEVKTTLTKEKLRSFLVQLKKFKEYFPEYADKTVYGGVAYMDDLDEAGREAVEEGLFAIVAPSGDAKVARIVNPEGFRPKTF